jgi:hypothetical protein
LPGSAAAASGGEFDDFSKDSQLQDLSVAVRCFFDGKNSRQNPQTKTPAALSIFWS